MSGIDAQQSAGLVNERAEKIFLGLIRQGFMSHYVGRVSQLNQDELRAMFALVLASIDQARKSVQPPIAAETVPLKAEVHHEMVQEKAAGKNQAAAKVTATTRNRYSRSDQDPRR